MTQRVASVIRLRPDKERQYRELHAEVWPDVLATLKRAHISNYSIFLRDGYLFSYLEYSGTDFAADMLEIASDAATRRWWLLTDPCQLPLTTAAAGERWAPAEELFHLD
jgi:L-rhamnose mutarotase